MPVPVVSSSTNQQQPQALPAVVPVPQYYVNQHTVFQPSSSVPVVPMNHWQQQPQVLPVCTSGPIPQYVNLTSFIFHQLQATTMPWHPVYQGMPVADQNPSHYPSQYQAPSAGPSHSRIQRRFHQAGSQHNHFNRSTGINPGYAWISANDEAGVGQVWRTPPKNPLIVDRN